MKSNEQTNRVCKCGNRRKFLGNLRNGTKLMLSDRENEGVSNIYTLKHPLA